MSSHTDRMVKALNAYRARFGLPELTIDPVLMSIAATRLVPMAIMDHSNDPSYGHRVFGSWCNEYARAHGFHGTCTDNLAEGDRSPEEAVQSWAGSPGHAEQMRGFTNINNRWVNQHFNLVGVAMLPSKHGGYRSIAIFGRKDA